MPIAAKVGKSAGRNLRFLHFRARYSVYEIVIVYRTITGDFLFLIRQRIVFASAPLPLTGAVKKSLRLPCGGVRSPRPTKALLYLFVGRHDHMPPRTTIRLLPLHRMSGSGAERTDDTSYDTKSNIPRKRVVKGHRFTTQNSVRGFLNRRFKLSFWVLLGQRPKVPRGRSHEIPLAPEGEISHPRAGARNAFITSIIPPSPCKLKPFTLS